MKSSTCANYFNLDLDPILPFTNVSSLTSFYPHKYLQLKLTDSTITSNIFFLDLHTMTDTSLYQCNRQLLMLESFDFGMPKYIPF